MEESHYLKKTTSAYTWTRILNTPFWAIFTLLPFIMYDLKATAWQIALIFSLKPVASLFSLYWSSRIKLRKDKLISNILWGGIFAHLPFLFIPWYSEPWFLIMGTAIYMLFYRGVNPAWMELLKINVPENARQNVFAYSSAMYHAGGAILAIGIGWLLDGYHDAWRWLFPITALIAIGALFFQIKIPIKLKPDQEKNPAFSLKQELHKPWKEVWELVKSRPDFFNFQIGFMLGGGGLMLWMPALPQFFFDVLHLNYKELALAMTLCKSIGYTAALPLWTRLMKRIDIFAFSGAVTALAALFPLGLMAAQWNLLWVYVAYFLYGLMQAGSEMSWNLSGPIFSKHEDSSTFTGVNVLSVGLRGCIAPPLGSLFCNASGAMSVLAGGGLLCLLGTWQMLRASAYSLPFAKKTES